MKTIVVISKKKYHEMCNLIVTQREVIRLLEDQTRILKRTICDFMVQQPHDIDFPATEKLHEDKFI